MIYSLELAFELVAKAAIYNKRVKIDIISFLKINK